MLVSTLFSTMIPASKPTSPFPTPDAERRSTDRSTSRSTSRGISGPPAVSPADPPVGTAGLERYERVDVPRAAFQAALPAARAVAPASRQPSVARLYRKAFSTVAVLPILAVTTFSTVRADVLPDFRALVENEGDAVVKISVRTEAVRPSADSGVPGFDPDQMPEYFRRFFEQNPQNRPPQPRRGAGFGSGFIISEDGYVITNAHVVDNAADIRVGLTDRHEYEAELVGADPASDIALLKIDSDENLPVVTIGDSDELAVGEWVLAIGSPFGFEHTATQGIVSALARSLPDDTYVPFIQTDVAVNPGNSGGPLFDTDGRVVGVNSQIYSRSGGYQGLSFAIPINVAMSIAEQLKTQGYATRGWLGVTIQNVSQALAESFGLDRPQGALVAQVSKDSPASRGGVESGDIILSLDGKTVPTSNALPPLVGAVTPGETVDVEVLREGERRTLSITIEPLDDERVASAAGGGRDRPEDESSRLGVVVADVPEAAREELGVEHGVLVSEIDPDGPAAEAGVLAGDVIVSLNRKKVESVRELEQLVEKAPVGEAMPILVQRDTAPMFLALTLPSEDG